MLRIFYIRLNDFFLPDDSGLFFRRILSPTEFGRGEKCRHERTRRERWGGAALVAYVLKRFYGLKNCHFVRSPQGKPYLSGYPDIFFNVSHSGGYLVCAFSDTEVGIDIEEKKRERMEVARRFFHPAETADLERRSEEERREYFFRYWSVKESFLKYTGKGLGGDLSSFRVVWEGEGAGIYEGEFRLPLYITECRIDPGYSCYVCSPLEASPQIFHLSWQEIAGKETEEK